MTAVARAAVKQATGPKDEINLLRSRWFLGFDCATKTLAFGLVNIDLAAYAEKKEYFRSQLAKLKKGTLPRDEAQALDKGTKNLLVIADGEVVDLFPGRPDKEIHTVERIRALANYVERRVIPSIEKHVGTRAEARTSQPADVEVVIEFQMGPNAPTRAIAAALVAVFHKYKVYLVGPSLKSKVYLCEEGKYCYFVEKYTTLYGANKAHAKFNFRKLEEVFGTAIPPTKPPALRGHIADSIMQVIGHLMHGKTENPEDAF